MKTRGGFLSSLAIFLWILQIAAARSLNAIPRSTIGEGDPNPWPRCVMTVYHQCEKPFSGQKFGPENSTDLCEHGSALTSVAMAMASRNVAVNLTDSPLHSPCGESVCVTTPVSLNVWLLLHDGYGPHSSLDWASIQAASTSEVSLSLRQLGRDLPAELLEKILGNCNNMVLSLLDFSHYILLDGYDKFDDCFHALDPTVVDPICVHHSRFSDFVWYQIVNIASSL